MNLFEKLASIQHGIWAHWQKYMHSICIKNQDGSITIPKEKVEHWERQIKTDYKDLTEKEKGSDRDQVRKYWNLIAGEKSLDDKELNMLVFKSIGAASMCWSETPKGIFESEKAEVIRDKILNELSKRLNNASVLEKAFDITSREIHWARTSDNKYDGCVAEVKREFLEKARKK